MSLPPKKPLPTDPKERSAALLKGHEKFRASKNLPPSTAPKDKTIH